MPYNLFKLIKVKCNTCKDIIISASETEWTECSCGSTKIMGVKSFMKVDSKGYTDMTIYNYDDLPKHQE